MKFKIGQEVTPVKTNGMLSTAKCSGDYLNLEGLHRSRISTAWQPLRS